MNTIWYYMACGEHILLVFETRPMIDFQIAERYGGPFRYLKERVAAGWFSYTNLARGRDLDFLHTNVSIAVGTLPYFYEQDFRVHHPKYIILWDWRINVIEIASILASGWWGKNKSNLLCQTLIYRLTWIILICMKEQTE